MHYLAPLAIVLALSGAIYRTQEVWNKTEYDLFITLGWAKDVASDFAQLQKAVRGNKGRHTGILNMLYSFSNLLHSQQGGYSRVGKKLKEHK